MIGNQDESSKQREFEDSLIKTIDKGTFEEIEKLVTPRALQKCESKSLLISMKVRSSKKYIYLTVKVPSHDTLKLENLSVNKQNKSTLLSEGDT